MKYNELFFNGNNISFKFIVGLSIYNKGIAKNIIKSNANYIIDIMDKNDDVVSKPSLP